MQCSSSCDIGIQTREVVCVTKFLGSLRIVKDSNCNADQPLTTKGCEGPPCNAAWFMSDWSEVIIFIFFPLNSLKNRS